MQLTITIAEFLNRRVLKNVQLAILLFLSFSCERYSDNVKHVLESAGNNCSELEKVIEHYRGQPDKEKLKAAYFIIGNMDDKFSLGGNAVEKFDVLFDILDSLHKKGVVIHSGSPVLKQKWDSLIKVHGQPSLRKAEEVPDYLHVDSKFLIENIDLAFKAREESPYVKNLSFDQFCEYVLPYRLGTESLENWRGKLLADYKTLSDTCKAKNSFEYAGFINRHIDTYMQINRIVSAYPFDIPVSKMQKARRGSCPHLVNYVTMAMRANGLPVGTDYALLWGNFGRGHNWNVLLTDSGTFFPFDAVRPKFGRSHTFYKISKAYRSTFAAQPLQLPEDTEDVPSQFLDKHRIDVTSLYNTTYDIKVSLKYPFPGKKDYAVICTFNNKYWIPQDWGTVKNKQAEFRQMGADIAYLVMYYNNGVLLPATDPFILKKDGSIKYLIPSGSQKQSMLLLRKYPFYFNNNRIHSESMLDARFQVSNKPDFSDSVTLFTIKTAPKKIEGVVISYPGKFRYARYYSAKKTNIAELQFYSLNPKTNDTTLLKGKVIGFPEISAEWESYYHNAFDRNLETYFGSITDGPAWTGLDLKKPEKIVKIKYCPRSDTNFILVGDTYELCVWKDGEWTSLGKQVAKDQFLKWNNVPTEGLYLLHNLKRGEEERIFTYKDGKQVWW